MKCKGITAGLLSLVILLVGCTAKPAEGNGVVSDEVGATAAETEQPVPVGYGKEDREVLTAYREIVPSGEHEVRILFLAAGKADSILVEVDDTVALIDTGISASPARLIPAMKQLGLETIDHLILTHTHNDHIGGYDYLSQAYPIGTVHTSSVSMNLALLDNLAEGKERAYHDPGDVIPLTEGVWLEVLGPIQYNRDDDNNNSMVLRLRVNGKTVLFAADMMLEEEAVLLSSGMIGDCDILKVGHHGQDDATSSEFLAVAQPEFAVISTDRDMEKDTAEEGVLTRLTEAGAVTYITDQYGLGLLCELEPDGTILWTEMKPEAEPAKIRLEDVSKDGQYVLLENISGRDVDLSGWLLYSDRGHEYYVFPEGASVASGETVTVACRDYDGIPDYEWNIDEAWHSDKKDRAYLYDSFGNLVDDKKSE